MRYVTIEKKNGLYYARMYSSTFKCKKDVLLDSLAECSRKKAEQSAKKLLKVL